jgi:hypothetical protein
MTITGFAVAFVVMNFENFKCTFKCLSKGLAGNHEGKMHCHVISDNWGKRKHLHS